LPKGERTRRERENSLFEILDGVDIVMRRRRDESDSARGGKR